MQTVLIDYGAGNLHSVEKAFRHVAGNGQDIIVSNHANVVGKADRIVLPGVGAFADCVKGIHAIPGMRETLEEQVIGKQKPFMGICVGMQVMLQQGLEHGEHEGLGWFKGTVKAITPKDPTHKIPHMGWNDLTLTHDHPALKGIQTGDHAYFVHSYHAVCDHSDEVLATVDYGYDLTAIIARDNLLGAQFHPEKSQQTGLTLIKNFLEL